MCTCEEGRENISKVYIRGPDDVRAIAAAGNNSILFDADRP